MEVKVITDVEQEPVTLDEVKSFLRIDLDYVSEDFKLLMFVSGAREKLEKYLNLSLAPKTLKWQWIGSLSDIPYGPVVDITSLTEQGDETEVEYDLFGLDFPAIGLKDNYNYIIYPVGYDSCGKLYNLTYEAGYDTLPNGLKMALLMQIDYDYKNQGLPLTELSPNAMKQAAIYSRNLAIQR